MSPLERLESIADGIRELYPTAAISIAIDLPLSDIHDILSHFGDEGAVISDLIKTTGTSVVVCIKQISFALTEKKIDPNLN